MFSKEDTSVKINTLIGKGSVLEGDFRVEGAARIDGVINGDVTVTGALIIGSTGAVHGDVTAESLLTGGEVHGNITVAQKVELTDTAKVLGDISTAVIVIDEHAIFQGGCNMNQDVPDRKGKARAAKALKAGRKSAKEAIAEALREVEDEESRNSETAEAGTMSDTDTSAGSLAGTSEN